MTQTETYTNTNLSRAGKIASYTQQGRIPTSLSNHFKHHNDGYAGAERELKKTIRQQPFDGKKIADALNRHPDAMKRFSVKSETKDLIHLNAKDWLGNVDAIRIHRDTTNG